MESQIKQEKTEQLEQRLTTPINSSDVLQIVEGNFPKTTELKLQLNKIIKPLLFLFFWKVKTAEKKVVPSTML